MAIGNPCVAFSKHTRSPPHGQLWLAPCTASRSAQSPTVQQSSQGLSAWFPPADAERAARASCQCTCSQHSHCLYSTCTHSIEQTSERWQSWVAKAAGHNCWTLSDQSSRRGTFCITAEAVSIIPCCLYSLKDPTASTGRWNKGFKLQHQQDL